VTTAPTDDRSAAGGAPWLRRHGLKLALSLVVGAAFVWLLQAGALPIVPDRQALARVSVPAAVAYFAIFSGVHVIRAARWYLLLAPVHRVPLRRVMAVAWIGFFAIVALPFRTGEMVRPLLIRRKGALSGWAAAGTVGAERVMDGLALSILLFVALSLTKPLDPLPRSIGNLPISAAIVPAAAYAALLGFFAAFVVMGVFYWRRDWARRTTERVVGFVSPRLASWLADRVELLAGGMRFLPRARYTVPFAILTAVYWFLNAAGSWVLARGCGFDSVSYLEVCVILGVLALGILTPNAPGFFGAYQFSLYAGLAMFFPQHEVIETGGPFVFLQYVLQISVTVLSAGVGMALEHAGLREALAPDPAEP